MKKCIVLIVTVLFYNLNYSQSDTTKLDPFGKPSSYIYNVGTLPTSYITVYKSKRSKKLHYKLIAKVKKVYPYAKIAGDRLREF